MKVLHLIDSGGVYGAEAVLLNLVEQQLLQGMAACILSVGQLGEGEKALEIVARSRKLPVKVWRMRPGFNPLDVWKIIKFARENGVDILHSHGYKFNVQLALVPKFIRKLPVVATMHGYLQYPFFSKGSLYNFLDRLSMLQLDGVVAVSDTVKDKLFFKKGGKVTVVANGIVIRGERRSVSLDQDVLDFVSRFDFIVGALGRLSYEKGFDLLLQAMLPVFRANPGVGLLILGEGEQRDSLNSWILQHGLQEQVMLAGYRSSGADYLSLFKVLAISSRTEGLPINLLEAMSQRVPVVSTTVGAIPVVLKGGDYGVLIPPENPGLLTEAISSVLADRKQAETRADRGLKHLKKWYSVEVMAAEYQRFYDSILRINS